MANHPKSFTYKVNEESIAIITFDLPDEKINKFSQRVMDELKELIIELKGRSELKGSILVSGKDNIFIAGADLKELASIQSEEDARKVITEGHKVFTEWSKLPFPTLAAINGACLGGGLEFALAFDYRIATTNPKTMLGFPEVKLGIIPGWGGTQRFTRLVGPYLAIEAVCSGKNIYTMDAYDMGLVDHFTSLESLVDQAVSFLKDQLTHPDWKERRKELSGPLLLSDDQNLFTFGLARAYIQGETKGHYPAPIIALDTIEEGISLSLEEGLKIEIENFLPLKVNDVSRNLMNIFFMSEGLKRETGTKNKDIKAHEIKGMAVIGAGIMGGGIATANIYKDISVLLKDISQDRIEVGVGQALKLLGDRVKKNRMTQKEMDIKLTHLTGTLSDSSLQDVDLIIEAVVEDQGIKEKVFKGLAQHMSDKAILASNTSTISITKLSESVKSKENFVGLHFFNPVHKMPLVEVIRGKDTSDETVVTVVQYAKRIGKTPIVINDGAGFLVNRILLPYLNEATLLIEDGVDFKTLDKVMTRFGMPMGPLTLLDVIGIDTAYKAGSVILKAFPDRVVDSKVLNALDQAKRLGQKNGLGFYKYKKGKTKAIPDETAYEPLKNLIQSRKSYSKEELLDRMTLPMILEATRILEDGIASSVRDVDMGMIMGTGFPPFRGGLLRYADSLGIKNIVDKCSQYSDLGKRFEPTQMLLDMAKEGKTFYPA